MKGDRHKLLRVITKWKVKEKRSIARRKKPWLRNIREWFNFSSLDSSYDDILVSWSYQSQGSFDNPRARAAYFGGPRVTP